MTAFVGKSGADAIYTAFKRMCIVVSKYHTKLDTAIELTRTAGLITSDQAAQAHAFVDSVNVVCDIFRIVAGNSGF